MGDAIKIFLSQVCIQKAIPFAPTTCLQLILDNSSLEEIEARYTDHTFNAEISAALIERPTRKFKSAAETLRALKT